MKTGKNILKISIILIIGLLAYLISSFSSYAYANEIDGLKYCYTNTECEIYRNKDTREKAALVSENLTLIHTYNDGTWSYVYYNNGEVHGWIESSKINDGSGPSGANVYIKKFKSIGTFKVTGYTPSPKENGGTGLTCTGIRAATVIGKCVAADRKVLPLWTQVYIEGIGYRTVMDTGVKGRVLDVLVSNNKQAYALTGRYTVYIVN